MPPSSSSSSLPAQTLFFSTSFPNLQDLVLDHLSGSDSRHLILPLLAVNHHWRGIARDYLLRPFKNAKISMVERVEESDKEGSSQMEPVFEGDYIKASASSTSVKLRSLFFALIRLLSFRSSSQATVLTTVLFQSLILESTSPIIHPISATDTTTTRRVRNESNLSSLKSA